MTEQTGLTIAFIRRRPESASRVLASLPTPDAAAFLEALPTRYAVRAVTHMNPWPASRLLAHMDPLAASALLRDLRFATASTIARLLAAPARAAVLAELPQRLRRQFERALAFPADTVGAHMTAATCVLAGDDKVADALTMLRDAEDDDADVVFIVDGERRFTGVVPVAVLVRRRPQTALADILADRGEALSARARLDAIRAAPGWQHGNALPVVSRHGELVGVLTRRALQAAADVQHDTAVAAPQGVADAICDALAATVSGVFDLVAAAPAGRPGGGDER